MPGQRMAGVLSGTAPSPGLFLALQVQVTPYRGNTPEGLAEDTGTCRLHVSGVLLLFCST